MFPYSNNQFFPYPMANYGENYQYNGWNRPWNPQTNDHAMTMPFQPSFQFSNAQGGSGYQGYPAYPGPHAMESTGPAGQRQNHPWIENSQPVVPNRNDSHGRLTPVEHEYKSNAIPENTRSGGNTVLPAKTSNSQVHKQMPPKGLPTSVSHMGMPLSQATKDPSIATPHTMGNVMTPFHISGATGVVEQKGKGQIVTNKDDTEERLAELKAKIVSRRSKSASLSRDTVMVDSEPFHGTTKEAKGNDVSENKNKEKESLRHSIDDLLSEAQAAANAEPLTAENPPSKAKTNSGSQNYVQSPINTDKNQIENDNLNSRNGKSFLQSKPANRSVMQSTNPPRNSDVELEPGEIRQNDSLSVGKNTAISKSKRKKEKAKARQKAKNMVKQENAQEQSQDPPNPVENTDQIHPSRMSRFITDATKNESVPSEQLHDNKSEGKMHEKALVYEHGIENHPQSETSADELEEWLEITGFHDKKYRKRTLNRQRNLEVLEIQKAELDAAQMKLAEYEYKIYTQEKSVSPMHRSQRAYREPPATFKNNAKSYVSDHSHSFRSTRNDAYERDNSRTDSVRKELFRQPKNFSDRNVEASRNLDSEKYKRKLSRGMLEEMSSSSAKFSSPETKLGHKRMRRYVSMKNLRNRYSNRNSGKFSPKKRTPFSKSSRGYVDTGFLSQGPSRDYIKEEPRDIAYDKSRYTPPTPSQHRRHDNPLRYRNANADGQVIQTRELFPELYARSNEQAVRGGDPREADRSGHKKGTSYFILKSFNFDNVIDAQRENVWVTTKRNEDILQDAFHTCRNVILFFSVNQSKAFQGFARMETPMGPAGLRAPSWAKRLPLKPSVPFRIRWIVTTPLPFHRVAHIHNSMDEGYPVCNGFNGQEVETKAGLELCNLFHEEKRNRQLDSHEPAVEHHKAP